MSQDLIEACVRGPARRSVRALVVVALVFVALVVVPRPGTVSVIPAMGQQPASGGAADPTIGGPDATGEAVDSAGGQEDPYTEAREQMVRRYIASVHPLMEPIEDRGVIEAIRRVPRHEFVPPELRDAAYLNQPLPIGHGQTISQPYIVALMTQLLELEPGDRTLEVGTGSGYQAAVLAEIVESVFTIEIIEPLATSARERLRRLEYTTVLAKHGDGYFGWAEHGPYDGIVVTAAATHIPPPLVEQLAVGGRMVIPVGPPFRTQQLMLLEKRADGSVTQRSVAPVAFVPFTRGEPER